jgi:hypothetical protein
MILRENFCIFLIFIVLLNDFFCFCRTLFAAILLFSIQKFFAKVNDKTIKLLRVLAVTGKNLFALSVLLDDCTEGLFMKTSFQV